MLLYKVNILINRVSQGYREVRLTVFPGNRVNVSSFSKLFTGNCYNARVFLATY